MKSLIPVTAALLLLAACGQRNASRQTAPAAAQTAVPDMHDAENALDYQGTYTGVFPAADVPGIAVTLTLGSATANAPANSPTTDATPSAGTYSPCAPIRRKAFPPTTGSAKTGSGGSTATNSPLRDRSPTSTSSPNWIRQLPQAATDAPANTIHPSGTGVSAVRPRTVVAPRPPPRQGGGKIKKPPARVSCGRSIETAPKRR